MTKCGDRAFKKFDSATSKGHLEMGEAINLVSVFLRRGNSDTEKNTKDVYSQRKDHVNAKQEGGDP